MSLSLIGTVGAAFFVAGIVKGMTGMGLPTFAMAVLGAWLSPLAAATLLLIPSFVTNLWQLFAGPNLPRLAFRLWPMMLAIIAGTVTGAVLLAGADTGLATGALGCTLVAYSAYTLLARQLRVPQRCEAWLSPLIGAATGLIAGGTGVFVIPAVPYLQALGFGKDDLVQALGLSFTVSTLALALGLAWHGAVAADTLAVSALAVLPALAGMWAGGVVRHRVSTRTFRRGFLISLLLLGIEMVARAAF